MHDIDVALERQSGAEAEVHVSRENGTAVCVRLRHLGYDCCEFQSDVCFSVGEPISIHLYRMGSIRARIISARSDAVEAEFIKDCPV